jgi:hypothetical protein
MSPDPLQPPPSLSSRHESESNRSRSETSSHTSLTNVPSRRGASIKTRGSGCSLMAPPSYSGQWQALRSGHESRAAVRRGLKTDAETGLKLKSTVSRPVKHILDNRKDSEKRAQIAQRGQRTVNMRGLRSRIPLSSHLAQLLDDRTDWKSLREAQQINPQEHQVFSDTESETSERGSVSRGSAGSSQRSTSTGKESEREPQWEDKAGFGKRIALPTLPTQLPPDLDQPKVKTSFPYPHHSHSTVASPIVSFILADSEIRPARKTSENLGEEPCTAWLQTRVDLEAARNRATGQPSVGEYW